MSEPLRPGICVYIFHGLVLLVFFGGVITGIMPRKKAGVQNTRGYPDKSEHCALQSGNFFTGRVGDTQL